MRATLGATLTGAALVLGGGAAGAQQEPASQLTTPVIAPQPEGPTRLYSVPRANVLGLGTNLMSMNLFVGGMGLAVGPVGLGISNVTGNALNVRADMGMGENLELGTGIGVVSATPWRGRLDLSGKWGLMREGPSVASVAGLIGGVLEVDANGAPGLGLQVGLPVTKLFAFNPLNTLGVTLMPTWNLGVFNTAATSAGLAGPFNFFGLGIGADYQVLRELHVLADTNLGFPVAGVNTTSTNLGVRYAFGRAWTGDLFVGFTRGAALGMGGGQTTLGMGSSWAY